MGGRATPGAARAAATTTDLVLRTGAAVGRSGVTVDLERLTIAANDVCVFENGAPSAAPLKEREKAFAAETVTLDIALGLGKASNEFFTSDLTEGYVQVNAHYMT